MKYPLVILSLLSSIVNAQTHVELPSIEDAPIATTVFAHESSQGRYALSSIQKAAFLQFGISDGYNVFRKKASKKIGKVADKTKDTVAYGIDTYTPLYSEHVFFLIAATYVCTVQKEYTQNLGTPFVRGMYHYVSVGENKALTGIKVEW